MRESTNCPECGAELPINAPRKLCPACLFQRGLEENTVDDVSQGEANSPAPGSHWTPPNIEDLAPRFPELEIIQLIGRGGMGAVYQTRQKNLDRIVALKILPPEIGSAPTFAHRFAREAQAMARLNHPHIVTIHEFGQRDGLFYFLMEFVDGLSLRALLDSGQVSCKEALAIVPQICDALQYAHEQNIVHRDIKPENILLNKQGQVKIADFGLAKLIGHNPSNAEAIENVMGTPQYMAPEQMQRPTEVDHRADIYALGVVFYQMLTGELPNGQFVPPSKKVVVDVRLDAVVLRALEYAPERRYQQISEIKTDVETIAMSEIRLAKTPDGSSRAASHSAKSAGRSRAAISFKLVLGGLLLSSVGIAFWGRPTLSAFVSHYLSPKSLADSPGKLPSLSIDQVMQVGLAKPISPWAWQELARRSLTVTDASKIVEALIAWLQTDYPECFSEPLTWLDTFLTDLARRDLISEDLQTRFLKSLHGKLRYEPRARMREGQQKLMQRVEWRNVWVQNLFDMTLLNEMRSISVDDEPVTLRQSTGRLWGFPHFYEMIDLPATAPGKHTVRLEVLSALVPNSDLAGLAPDAPSANWPPAKRTWIRTARRELVVFPRDAVIVNETQDPALDPMAAGGLSVTQIIVRAKDNHAEAVVDFDLNDKLPIAISFDVALKIGDQTIPCGQIWAEKGADGRLSVLSNQSKADSDPLDSTINEVDVILTPNPTLVETITSINRIWGQTIVLPHIPLKRLDTEKAR